MSTKEISPNQLSFTDTDISVPTAEAVGVRSYDFSALASFPSAQAAHADQVETLGDSAAKGPMNPAAIEEDPSSANPTNSSYTNPAKIEQQRKAREDRNRRYRPRRDPDYGAEPWELR